jgi:hypothetical protein
MTAFWDYVGGLVASNGGTITDCHVRGQVYGGRHIGGGLVGWNGRNATVTRCSFRGSVGSGHGGSSRRGGLVPIQA